MLEEMGVEEHDGDVRFKRGSGNMAIPATIIGTVCSLCTWLWVRYTTFHRTYF